MFEGNEKVDTISVIAKIDENLFSFIMTNPSYLNHHYVDELKLHIKNERKNFTKDNFYLFDEIPSIIKENYWKLFYFIKTSDFISGRLVHILNYFYGDDYLPRIKSSEYKHFFLNALYMPVSTSPNTVSKIDDEDIADYKNYLKIITEFLSLHINTNEIIESLKYTRNTAKNPSDKENISYNINLIESFILNWHIPQKLDSKKNHML